VFWVEVGSGFLLLLLLYLSFFFGGGSGFCWVGTVVLVVGGLGTVVLVGGDSGVGGSGGLVFSGLMKRDEGSGDEERRRF
jgi:hypothetical protein